LDRWAAYTVHLQDTRQVLGRSTIAACCKPIWIKPKRQAEVLLPNWPERKRLDG